MYHLIQSTQQQFKYSTIQWILTEKWPKKLSIFLCKIFGMWICCLFAGTVYVTEMKCYIKQTLLCLASSMEKTPPIYTQCLTELCIIAHTLARCSNHVRFLYVAEECWEQIGMRDWATLVHSVWAMQIDEILGLSLIGMDFVWKLIFSFLLWDIRNCYPLPNSKIVQLKFPFFFWLGIRH